MGNILEIILNNTFFTPSTSTGVMVRTPGSDTNMEYQYNDLGSRDEIGILVLKPAAVFDDDLHASTVHRRYPIGAGDASGVNYWNATSYAWGIDPPSKNLYIDSTSPEDPNCGCTVMRITPNVDAMLRHYRHGELEHCLWIDAICLNQSNMPEKNQQIPQMAWIYRLALRVLIWLGEDDETAQTGIKLVQEFAKASGPSGLTKIPQLNMSISWALVGSLGQHGLTPSTGFFIGHGSGDAGYCKRSRWPASPSSAAAELIFRGTSSAPVWKLYRTLKESITSIKVGFWTTSQLEP